MSFESGNKLSHVQCTEVMFEGQYKINVLLGVSDGGG